MPQTTPKKCPVCGETFTPEKKMTQKYCSDECRKLAAKRSAMVKECAWCGKEFTPRYGQKYCSPDCARLAQNKKNRERRGPVYRKCKECGKTFEVGTHHRTYCSQECREAYCRKARKEYDQAHKEQRKIYARQWREKNIEKVRKYQREYQRGRYSVPAKCRARGQTSCLTCSLPPEECDG